MDSQKKLTFPLAVGLFILMLGVIISSLFFLHTEPHIPLFLCVVLLSAAGLWYGFSWNSLEKGIVNGIKNGVQPIIVLALIGILIGAWMYSGAIPSVTVYALSFIEPSHLLLTALFSCMIISTLVGSSLTTVSTIGVALIGVASAAGVPLEWTAGAVICGACFGDKMSPMSDTTNFAAGIGEISIFEHIRHMMGTTIPALLITVVLFYFLGLSVSADAASTDDIAHVIAGIKDAANVTPWALLSPLLVVLLAIKRVSVIPVLTAGIISSGILTAIFVPDSSIQAFMAALQNGTVFETDNEAAAKIINRGGLQSMMGSVSLIMIAFALGGLMEKIGLISALLEGVMKGIRSKGSLIAATVCSSIGVNLATGEQYLSILIPGQSYKSLYDKQNIQRKFLSRSLEDGGTLINPLIPWGVSGAFMATALGVPVIDYIPFTFFLYISPIISVLVGFVKK
ncbi:Na+/H+ antiporter NhaC [Bacillus halotolerans]|uniref:Na+/H+ antiporter NhaC n=1 Tax=Bacillus halotolerans TaxID=260554 RepID=UPI0022804B70|nr:Na+/H+ antiporter NhaC [Bacillus halotolerans]MCY8978354.1 Na+/H+ antiporter NhaC [Bacillus halotolerans]MEC1663096.1 Na+/H+ antiporter NhaC [Bacillus halotolerans]